MKKKYREITVDGTKYAWMMGRENCDGDGGVVFIIWKDKKIIHEELTHNVSMTPGKVAEIIKGLKHADTK